MWVPMFAIASHSLQFFTSSSSLKQQSQQLGRAQGISIFYIQVIKTCTGAIRSLGSGNRNKGVCFDLVMMLSRSLGLLTQFRMFCVRFEF